MTGKPDGKRIMSILGSAMIWLFVLFSVLVTLLVFTARKNQDGIPEIFGKSFITILSPSMEPVYQVGDLILVSKLDNESKQTLKVGDIITYRAPMDIDGDGQIGDLCTHRISFIDKGKGLLTTKGDNNEFVDHYVLEYEDIIGVSSSESRIAALGKALLFLRTNSGFFVCIVLPLILFFLYAAYTFLELIVTERMKNAPIPPEKVEEIKLQAIEEYVKSLGRDP